MDMEIIKAAFPNDRKTTAELLREYADSVGFDLGFQSFEEEVTTLPGAFAEPSGAVLLGNRNGQSAGVVAYRPWAGDICEMKRLFIRPEARGMGAGRKLAIAVISLAKERGYARMRLDTVAEMAAANVLYQSLGFKEIEAYCHNPLPNPRFYELLL